MIVIDIKCLVLSTFLVSVFMCQFFSSVPRFFRVLNWVFDIWIVQKKTSDLSFLCLANTSMPTFRWADRYFACQLSFSMWVSLFLPSTLSHRISRYTNSKNESRQNVVLLPACYHMSAADASENTNRVHVNIWGIFIWNFHLHAPVYPPPPPPLIHIHGMHPTFSARHTLRYISCDLLSGISTTNGDDLCFFFSSVSLFSRLIIFRYVGEYPPLWLDLLVQNRNRNVKH